VFPHDTLLTITEKGYKRMTSVQEKHVTLPVEVSGPEEERRVTLLRNGTREKSVVLNTNWQVRCIKV